nr:uncharacterized protein LOC117280712 [Nicotiana tomentosiformis]
MRLIWHIYGKGEVQKCEIEDNLENDVDQVFDEFPQHEETRFLGELQSTKEIEEDNSEKIGSLRLDNMPNLSDESEVNTKLIENSITNIFSSIQFTPFGVSLGYNLDVIAVFEVPDDNDLNSNNGHLEAKHFVLKNEMSGDTFGAISSESTESYSVFDEIEDNFAADNSSDFRDNEVVVEDDEYPQHGEAGLNGLQLVRRNDLNESCVKMESVGLGFKEIMKRRKENF